MGNMTMEPKDVLDETQERYCPDCGRVVTPDVILRNDSVCDVCGCDWWMKGLKAEKPKVGRDAVVS